MLRTPVLKQRKATELSLKRTQTLLINLILGLIIISSSLSFANPPIALEGDAILIDQLPSDVTGYWQECQHASSTPMQDSLSCDNTVQSNTDENTSNVYRLQSLQLRFILDESIQSLYPGIIIEEIQGADELYLNGELVNSTGSFPPRYENASYYSRFYFLPPEKLLFNKPNTLRLLTYSSESENQHQYLTMTFRSFEDILTMSFKKDLMLSFVAALLFMIFILQLYYFLRIPGSYDALGLSGFSFLCAMFIFLNHHFVINMGFDTNSLLRWKCVAFIFAQLALNFYLFHTYELKKHILNRSIFALYLIFGISVLIWPSIYHLPEFYHWSKLTAYIPPLVIIGLILFVKRSVTSKPQIFLLISLSIYLIFLSLDVTRYSWIGLLEYRENTTLIIALVGLSVTAALVSTEKYWEYFKGATYDHLTGTLLKASFIRRLSEEMQRCRRSDFCLLVAVIDVDQFKVINQNYGHDVGDKALVILSATLTRALRQFDLICRLKDDEFCVAATLPNGENNQAFLLRLHEEINAAAITLENNEKLSLKATTGAVIYDAKRHEAPEMLLLDAEHSVTEAKMKQRGSIHWFDTENPPLQFIF